MNTGARVLQLVLSLNPGGTERLVVELASRLHPRVPMAVCCLDEAGLWASALQERGIRVSVLGRQAGFRPGLGRRVAHAAAQHGATLIHAHHYSPFVYGAIARLWRPSTRLLFTEHGRLSDAGPSPRRRAVNRLLRLAPQGVFAVSADLKRHLVAEGFPPQSVRVIYNGIDPVSDGLDADRNRIRQMLGVGDDVLTIGTVARLDPVKDLGTLIESVSHLIAERRVRLVIIGEGPDLTRLKHTAAARGVSNDVTFVGHRDDVRRWLTAFDVFANSSTSEGVSLTILEAMAAGLPVVATAVGGTPEVVDASTGYLVPPRDPVALAAAIRSLAKDVPRRATLGRAGRQRVATSFTLDRMVEDYRKAYEL
jgi:glycosyltransferase involved in cell wall biosynthesis